MGMVAHQPVTIATDRPLPVRLRRVTPADQPAVERLLGDLGYSSVAPANLPATLRTALARSDLALFLAVDQQERPLGFLQLSQRPQPHLGGTLVCVDALVVADSARGRGIGRRLLKRVHAYARAHRAVRVELHTNRARPSYARGFYRANGYVEADSALFRLAALEGGLAPALPPATVNQTRRPA